MKISRKFITLVSAVSLALVLTGAGLAKPATATDDTKTFTVNIKDFTFDPETLTVPAGAKVTWVNKDEEPHKVAGNNEEFVSQALDTDEQFTFEFKTPGTYEYYCTLHPKMIGKIIVRK
ncbi:MAG: cupredoxin domain-containing protein [Candidatus Acidiferrales bacterium]